MRIIRSLFAFMLLLPFMITSAQNNCTCDRHGMLVEFTNPHNPDYEQKLEEWVTENAVVAKQLGQFGMVNWYDIATPGEENLSTQTRRKHHIENVGCVWNESTNKELLPEVHIRYKLTDSKILQGNRSWQSGMDTEGLEVSNMTDSIYGQKAYEPDNPGNEYTYSVTWHLTAL